MFADKLRCPFIVGSEAHLRRQSRSACYLYIGLASEFKAFKAWGGRTRGLGGALGADGGPLGPGDGGWGGDEVIMVVSDATVVAVCA